MSELCNGDRFSSVLGRALLASGVILAASGEASTARGQTAIPTTASTQVVSAPAASVSATPQAVAAPTQVLPPPVTPPSNPPAPLPPKLTAATPPPAFSILGGDPTLKILYRAQAASEFYPGYKLAPPMNDQVLLRPMTVTWTGTGNAPKEIEVVFLVTHDKLPPRRIKIPRVPKIHVGPGRVEQYEIDLDTIKAFANEYLKDINRKTGPFSKTNSPDPKPAVQLIIVPVDPNHTPQDNAAGNITITLEEE